MPTALIKITQGATTDIPGRALKVEADGATDVVFSNGDNTGVVSWYYELLYTPPGSVIATTTQGPGVTTTFNMGVPDVPGSYRVRITVVDAAGVQDIDIRNAVVAFPYQGVLAAPYQANPLPLPLTGVGNKPDEMNVGGQPYGWDGADNPDQFLMYQLLQNLDEDVRLSTIQTTDAAVQTVRLLPRVLGAVVADGDYEVTMTLIGREDPSTGDHGVFSRRAFFEVTGGAVVQIGATQTPVADLLDGAAGWTADLGVGVGTIEADFAGDVGDTVDWTLRYTVRKTN